MKDIFLSVPYFPYRKYSQGSPEQANSCEGINWTLKKKKELEWNERLFFYIQLSGYAGYLFTSPGIIKKKKG